MPALVIKNDGIGDLILASGVISEIARIYNGADLITCEENRDIAHLIPGLNRIDYVSRDSLQFGTEDGIRDSFSDDILLMDLMQRHYDAAFMLRRFVRQSSLIIMNCVNADQKYCFWKHPTNVDRSEAVRSSHNWKHIVDETPLTNESAYFANCLKTAISENIDHTPQLDLSSFASDKHFHKSIAVGLSGSSRNAWNPKNWLEIAQHLKSDGYKIHLFGGKDLHDVAEDFCRSHTDIVNHVGKLNLKETLEILRSFPYYIGNDTGLSHMASTVVPQNVIIVGGGTIPRFFPWTDSPHQLVITKAMSCFDCNWMCSFPTTACMETISPQEVLPLIKSFFDGSHPAGLHNLGHDGVFFHEFQFSDKQLCLDTLCSSHVFQTQEHNMVVK